MNLDVISANKAQLQVPSSWQIRPLKSVASFRKGLSILKTDLSDEGVRVISYGQIHDKDNTGVKLADGLLRYIPQELTRGGSGARLRYGDLVFADTSEDLEGAGNAAFVDTGDEVFAGYHTVICRLHDENVLPKFLAYVVNSECWRSQVRRQVSGVKVFSITRRILSSTFVQFPAYPEQQRIVQLLDVETAKIDQAMSLLRRELETMEQLKKSIIFEAVTKGLDPAVPMKPSGVEWIGDIPEHWETNRLRNVFDLVSGATPSKDVIGYWQGTIPWVSSQEVKDDVISETTYRISESAVASCSAKVLPKGTPIVVVRSGILQHTLPISLLGDAMAINQDVKGLLAKSSLAPEYLFYFIRGNNANLLKVLIKDKSTVDNISTERLKSLGIVIPPVDEQSEIIRYLRARCSSLDRAAKLKQNQMDILANQRKTLIFEYVTGKRRVSEVA